MADRQGRLVDLSHVIQQGMITYKGLPGPIICDYWSREGSAAQYDDGSSFQIGRIDMVANTGTYMLLGAGVLLCEYLTNLGALPDSGFRFTAVPPKIAGMGTFPVRAFAEIEVG